MQSVYRRGMARIDLHTHSTASDGTFTPAQIVREAERVGLAAVALTDHDTVDGLPEFREAGKDASVQTIPGCELGLSSRVGSMHIVALWVPEHSARLAEAFRDLAEKRALRNAAIIKKLQEIGVHIEMEEVEALAKGTIGRPHIAQLLIARGWASTMDDAFARFLGARGAAYAPRTKLSAEEGLELLSQEGATAIVAHPGLLRVSRDELAAELIRLQPYGLRGMEVHYSEHRPDTVRSMATIAKRLGLLQSGGSDFHGDVKPAIKLGVGRGTLRVDLSVLEALQADRINRGLWI